MDREIKAPIDKETAKSLRAGDYVKITGTIYTARDAAHKRMAETLDKGEKLPIEIEGTTIYYLGPTPARKAVLSVQQVLPLPAVWINIRQGSWILA